MMTVLERKDVPLEHTWNKEGVYPTWEDWQVDFEEAKSDLKRLTEYPGTLGQAPERLAAWFEQYGSQYQRLMRLVGYARMHLAVDANNTEAKGYYGQVIGVYAQFSAAVAFVEPEILALGEIVFEWAEKHPQLSVYKHYFDNILRLKPHKRSQEVEELFGMLEEPFSGVSRTIGELTNTDLKFADALDSQDQKHPVLQATVAPTGVQSTDPLHRKSAWKSYADGYLSMENTLASGYLTNISQWLFIARARGYQSVLEYMLSPTNTPVEVFHNLIETFKENLPVWHKYWDVKRKILGQDKIHPCDVWAPILKDPPVIPYHQAVDWICEALRPLGDEYIAVMRKGCLEDRWVDWAPNAGKRQGAASSLMVENKPPFIFTSYDDTMFAMSVLAHELGHSMHSYFTYHNVVDVYNGYEVISSTVAETASNFNQAMLRAYLKELKGDDPAFQIAMIDEAIFNFHRYFFTMPTLARLEYEVCSRAQDGKPITVHDLKNLVKAYYAEGYGDTMTDDPDRTAITWAQYLHLYYPFYTFQYAIGISAASFLANGVLAGKKDAAENYLDFLKAGGSMYTMDLFNLAGVDMASPEPVKAAFEVLSDMVDQLEALAT
jgi:oligoendopeptidase F